MPDTLPRSLAHGTLECRRFPLYKSETARRNCETGSVNRGLLFPLFNAEASAPTVVVQGKTERFDRVSTLTDDLHRQLSCRLLYELGIQSTN